MTTADLPRPEVPRAIAVVRDYVNTTDRETGTDEIDSPAELGRYLLSEGLLTGASRATSADLVLARRLRAGLRRALEHNHDGATEPVPGLDAVLGELSIRLGWDDDGPVLRATGSGVRRALADIGLAAHDAASAGLWWRLKICSWEECEWAYYDHSKNRSRAWCEYGCGNKVKTRAYRARQRAQAN
jgi:predicted RNA-binding Zn ribbon-like protein